MKKKLIYIAGGGTGGHIYPGVAIAKALQKINSNLEIEFVGTRTGLETKIVPREGFKLNLIAGGKMNFSGHYFEKLKTVLKIPLGVVQSIFLILKSKPGFVLGVGGYASFPLVLAASWMRVPTAIWEPNAHPGMANRILSRFVDCCFVVFEEAKINLPHKDIFMFGMPVRAEMELGKKTARLDSNFHILSFGGSQGSRAISTVLSDAILAGGKWLEGVQVVHQIGSVDFERVNEKYQGHLATVTPMEFIYDMPKYYDWADLVIARGGASTISELAAFGVPPIIIPLPAADNHQQKNAEALVRSNAGVLILQNELTVNKLIEEVEKLKSQQQLRQTFSENIRKFFQPNAAGKIADKIMERIAL